MLIPPQTENDGDVGASNTVKSASGDGADGDGCWILALGFLGDGDWEKAPIDTL